MNTQDAQSKILSYAGFWKRFAAYIIDSTIVYIGNFFVSFTLGIPYDVLANKAKFAEFADDYILSFISAILLTWIYQAVMESSAKQATLGKMALGIIVVDLFGNRVSFGKASGRHFGKILSGLMLGIGFLMIGFTAKKQGLHDKMAKCLVINKNS